MPEFTRRQKEVLALIAKGLSCKQIARELHISHETVRKHVSHLRSLLGLRRAPALASYWYRVASERKTPDNDPLGTLTAREKTVARLLAKGESAKEIAKTLGISPATAAKHRENLLGKLDLRRTSQLPAIMYRPDRRIE